MMRPENRQQALVVTGLVLCTFCDGYIFGQMSGMISTLQSKDADIDVTADEITWIAAIINIACFFGYGVGVFVCENFGRKKSVTFLTAPIIISWVMLYYAQSVKIILISRVIVGISFGGVLYLSYLMTAEYTAPNIRGMCLNLVNSVGLAVGTGFGHILGILFHWRTTALIGIIPSLITVILPFFWKESPSWLAAKGRFEECKEAFRTLRGCSEAAEKELKLLIALETSKRRSVANESSPSHSKLIFAAMRKKYFWKIFLIICVVAVFRTAGGKVIFSTFGITMLQDITGKSNILLYTFLVDALVIVGSVLSCILISKMRMRTLLFSAASVGIFLLTVLCACLYFKPENDTYFPWINSTLLGLHFIALNTGPYPLLEAVMGEIFPLELKVIFLPITGISNGLLIFTTVKLAPSMFASMGYHGVYLLNVLLMTLSLIYLWIYLPETKGRTLQEIELFYKNNTFEKTDALLEGEQLKVLIKS